MERKRAEIAEDRRVHNAKIKSHQDLADYVANLAFGRRHQACISAAVQTTKELNCVLADAHAE